ncbi:MAG: GNAT family N-acetyltransferase [Rickettsiales bacterium]|nr:GNAT family N-acetyltransferase [Rickettsiales bacterium]
MSEVVISPLKREEFERVWPIFHTIIGDGKTYSYDPDLTIEEARAIWCADEKTPYIAEVDGVPVGTFYLRANQLGLGNHVANGGFMVAPEHAGKGYGRQMGQRMIDEAKATGYHGMQFNFVVEDNVPSLKIWTSLGFEIVGTVPDAMRHREKGLMAVHIMYKKL